MLKVCLSGIIVFISFALEAETVQEYKQEISSLIQNYGSLYSGGYSVLEKGHIITIEAQKEQFILDVVTDNPAQLRLQATLQRKEHPNFQHSIFAFPDFPALNTLQLWQVDAVLAARKKLYLLSELNQYLVEIDLSKGHKALAFEQALMGSWDRDKNQELSVRHFYNPPFAVLFYESKEWASMADPFAIWINLETKSIEGANWLAFPLGDGGMMSDERYNFIDQAMMQNGDFGVYGSVAGGLADLIEYNEVQISDSPDTNEYSVSVSPRNGYGHTLIFSINKTTGELSQPLSMHMLPMPEPIPMPEPELPPVEPAPVEALTKEADK